MNRILCLLTLWMAGPLAWAAEQGISPSPEPAARVTERPPQSGASPPEATDRLLRDFEQARRIYLTRRLEIEKEVRGLNEQQRQVLREQLQSLRENQIRAREDVRQRLLELRQRLPDHRDLVDQVRERARQRPRRGD